MPIKNMPKFDDLDIESEDKKENQNLNNILPNNIEEMLNSLMNENNLMQVLSSLGSINEELEKALSNLGVAESDDEEDDEVDDIIDTLNLDTKSEDQEEVQVQSKKTNKKINPLSERGEEISKRKNSKFTKVCQIFSRKYLYTTYPELRDYVYERDFPSQVLNELIPNELLDIYDRCSVISESVYEEMKYLTFMLSCSEISDKYYYPIFFSIYCDENHDFKIYFHEEQNPITENNGNITIYTPEDLINESVYDNIMENEDLQDNQKRYLKLLEIGEALGLTTFNPNSPKNVFIEKKTFPLATISELGEFHSQDTKYFENGLYYIGDLDLNDTETAKYFIQDYELTPIDNSLRVYGVFSYDDSPNKSTIQTIEKNFNSKFIETNKVFQNSVEVLNYYPNGIIIHFNEI